VSTSLHVASVGAGRPLVLLHGWAMHGGLFAPILPALAQRWRVHVVDLPGHGASADLGDWSLDAVVDAVAASVDTADEPLALAGWSLGGLVALRWARRDPARVRRLLLLSTTPRFVAGADWPHAMEAETLARFGADLARDWPGTLSRFLALQVHGSERARETLALLRRQAEARAAPTRAALDGALALIAAEDLRDEVASLDLPAFVVAGDRDALAPIGASRWLATALRGSKLVEIPGAAHAPFLSHRAAFDAALGAFADGR